MEYILEGNVMDEKIRHGTYLDDWTPAGVTVDECWRNTLIGLSRVTRAGLPISIGKCQFLTYKVALLGLVLASSKL